MLRPGGIYTLNTIDNPPLGFVRAEAATLRDVALIALPDQVDGVSGGNFVLVASDRRLPLAAVRRRLAAAGEAYVEVATGARLERLVDGADVLTDDHAPVDQLITVEG